MGMAKKTLTVMISSRCDDRFPNGGENSRSLTDIRRALKDQIQNERIFGVESFEVWINEDTSPQSGKTDSWETCLNAARKCDIFIALYNGNAGWAPIEDSDIGICHAELKTALDHAPGKVFSISIAEKSLIATLTSPIHQRFHEFFKNQSLFRGGGVRDEAELRERVRQTMQEAVVSLARQGVREASRGRYHMGEALDWSRLDFARRQERIVAVLRDALGERADGNKKNDAQASVLKIGNEKVSFIVSGIPAALSVAAAREMVGQPFLRDHRHQELLNKNKSKGPVHIVGCHRAITEAQALRILGFPDATVISAPFGIYAVDDIQKIQMVFITNCRDETTTRHGLQRFFEWLEQTGEDKNLVKRATSRKKIVDALASEISVR
jgi:hypothetical protein